MAQGRHWKAVAAGHTSRRRALAAACAGVTAMTIAAACGGDDKNESAGTSNGRSSLPQGSAAQTAPSGGSPKQGGILRSAEGPLAAELDIHKTNAPIESAFVWQWVGNFLVRFTKDSEIEPDLAAALPEITDGGTTFTFKLNPAATWQQRPPVNGRNADSEDVKFTFERIRDPRTASPRASHFTNVDRIETPNATTVVFKTKSPEADLLAKMSDQHQLIVPKEWAGKDKPVGSAADVVGTGPYVLDSFVLDQGFTLSRRPDGYWKPNTAWLDGWDLRRVDDAQAQLAAARADQVDMVGLLGLTGDQVSEFERDTARWYVLQSLIPVRECLLLNQTRDLYQDVRVRQAIWRAVDRRQIFENIFGGLGIPGGPITPAATQWVVPDAELEQLPGFKQDRNAELTEARQLLAAAGYPDGFEDTMTFVTAFPTNQEAELYVPQLQRIGIRYRPESVGTDWSVLLQRQASKNYSAAATLFLSGAFPDGQLNQYHHSGASRNYAGYSNPQLDAMMDAQSREFDVAKRRQLVHDIQRELITNPSGFVWIGSPTRATASRTYYKGVYVGNFYAGYPLAESGYFDK